MTRVAEAKRTTRRIVGQMPREYVVELRPEGLRMRPLRSRAGGKADILVPWGAIYIRAFMPKRRAR